MCHLLFRRAKCPVWSHGNCLHAGAGLSMFPSSVLMMMMPLCFFWFPSHSLQKALSTTTSKTPALPCWKRQKTDPRGWSAGAYRYTSRMVVAPTPEFKNDIDLFSAPPFIMRIPTIIACLRHISNTCRAVD
ncbi:hypothetical protein K456DRAFT_1948361 [Colletotrichum gloeosporioides 23]|nr:hypothetical protein K456DRAFT_1948361 [Colletotrichum gloeosporioides 23]